MCWNIYNSAYKNQLANEAIFRRFVWWKHYESMQRDKMSSDVFEIEKATKLK